MIDEKLLVLLGLGVAGIMVTATAYQNDVDDYCDDEEGYCNTGVSSDTIINYEFPKQKQNNVSPLDFGSMVGGKDIKEQYVNYDGSSLVDSNYIILDDYSKNPDKIKVYNPSNDTVSLPVGDMTDVGAAEDNKYIYDRSLANIGFTSTKIGTKQKMGGDKIRGDLPIIPDKTGWFQTSADPSTALLLGAMNVHNGISDTKPSSISILPTTGGTGDVAFSAGKGGNYSSLDDLRATPSGVAFSLGGTPQKKREVTTEDLINASINQKILDNQLLGEGTLYVSAK